MTTPTKVLVADDEETIRFVLSEALGAAGFQVTVAQDGNEALALVRSEHFDVVLTDIRMPGKTGIELLQDVKAFNPKIEVIIMTSHASLQSSMAAISAGAHDYILKPFQDLRTVCQLVRRTAETVRLTEEKERLVHSLQAANSQLSESNENLAASNELLAARASTIGALLDYSQGISALVSPQKFALETASAVSKLANGRPAVVFRVSKNPLELVPTAAVGVDFATVKSLAGPPDPRSNTEVVAWLREIEARRPFPRTSVNVPLGSTYVAPIQINDAVSDAVCVFDNVGPIFPPSVRSVLDRFMHQVQLTAENIAMHESMRNLAIRDGVTGLYNHRYFQDRMVEEFARAKRHKHDLSLIFIDVDHFKKFNDQYGHPSGDRLLREMGVLIRGGSRASDLVASRSVAPGAATEVIPLPAGRDSDIAFRYGGEEFVILLTDTAIAGARIRAERLRIQIAGAVFSGSEEQPSVHITASLGVAGMSTEHRSPAQLINEADRAMYIAKQSGRNRVCAVADQPDVAGKGHQKDGGDSP